MKVLGYVVAALVAIGLALYAVVFFNPQNDEQEAVNAAWSRFAEDVAELGDAIEAAQFIRDDRTAAAGYRHIARLVKLDDLDRHLPADTPRVCPAQRKRIIAARQAAISQRYAGGG